MHFIERPSVLKNLYGTKQDRTVYHQYQGTVLFSVTQYPDTRKCGRVGTCVPVPHNYFVALQLMGKASTNNIRLGMNPQK